MPRPVVPIAPGPCSADRLDRAVVGQDQVRAALETPSWPRTPARRAPRASPLPRAARSGSITTPLPIRQRRPGCRMPEGTRCSTSVSPVADHAVAGVGAALVAGDHVGGRAQRVDDLALALVAPLGAHDHGARHRAASSEKRTRHASRGRTRLPVATPRAIRAAAGRAARGRVSPASPAPRSAMLRRLGAGAPLRLGRARRRGAAVASTFGSVSSGLAPGGSLGEHVERGGAQRAAGERAASAASSTTPPREQLTRIASRLHERELARADRVARVVGERHVQRQHVGALRAARRASARAHPAEALAATIVSSGSCAITVMSNARARVATSRPMRPKPRMPERAARTARGPGTCVFSQRRRAGRPPRGTMWRSSASMQRRTPVRPPRPRWRWACSITSTPRSARGRAVDVVEPGAGAHHHLEARARAQHVGGHLGGAAHEQALHAVERGDRARRP